MKLKGKVAIVTGGGRGIGRACALELAKEGASVVVNYSKSAAKANSVVNTIKKSGGKAIAIQCDVSEDSNVVSLMNDTIKKFKKIDILVNNAGVYLPGPIDKTSTEIWDKTLDINLKGCFLCSREVLKHMKKRKTGSIVNITSIAGSVGFSNSSAYCASKGGITNMTREFALENASLGIRVNSVAPGLIKTDMTKAMINDPKTIKGLLPNIPLSRAGDPKEIAKGVLFLASDDASYVTGHNLVIDGGWLSH